MEKYFNIAHYTGHKSLDELYRCYRIYQVPLSQALMENNIYIQSYDFKEKSDIHVLSGEMSIKDINIDKIDHINAFHIGSYLESLRKKEIEFCINAAIFFQVMMEASINDVIGSSKKNFMISGKII